MDGKEATFISLRHKARHLRKIEKLVLNEHYIQTVESFPLTEDDEKSINDIYSLITEGKYYDRKKEEQEKMPKNGDTANKKLIRVVQTFRSKNIASLLAFIKKHSERSLNKSDILEKKIHVLESILNEEVVNHKFPAIEKEVKETIGLYTQEKEFPQKDQQNVEKIESFLKTLENIETKIEEE